MVEAPRQNGAFISAPSERSLTEPRAWDWELWALEKHKP